MSMRNKLAVIAGAMAASLPSWAAKGSVCVWATGADGKPVCVPVEQPNIIIIDPSWLTAGGVMLLMLVVLALVNLAQLRSLTRS